MRDDIADYLNLRLPYSFGAAFLRVKIKFIHVALKCQYFYLFHSDPIFITESTLTKIVFTTRMTFTCSLHRHYCAVAVDTLSQTGRNMNEYTTEFRNRHKRITERLA